LRLGQENLKRDPFYDEDYGVGILNDSLMTEDPNQSDQETAKRVTEHPRVYNSDFALDNWSKGIKNSVSSSVGGMENSGLGIYRDVNTQEVKFHKGKDANGNYIAGVSDQMLDQALASDPRVGDRYLWEAVAKNNGLDQRIDRAEIDKKFLEIKDNPPKEYVQEVRRRAEAALLKNQVEKERFSAQRFGQNPSNKKSGSGATPDQIVERDTIIQALQTPFGSMGEQDEVRPETKQFVKQFIGGKFGGMPIEDVEIVRAGKPSDFDKSTKNYDRYVFKVTEGKTSGEANTTTRDIDLSSGDYAFWNTIMNTVPGNKKIDIGDLTKQNETQKQANGEFDNL
jgi:hypothetical protein